MQIHEIFRRNTNEGILKGVKNYVVKPVVNTAVDIAKPVVNYAVDQAKGVAKAPLNTAEYFANKVLNAAGVPQDQQGSYSKYGHMAAGQRQGITNIAQQEHYIGNELSKEWSSTGTLNGKKAETLDPEAIKQAAIAFNAGSSNLKINTDNVVRTVQTLAPQYIKDREAQQLARAQGKLNIKNLMAELEKQYTLSKDPSQPITNKQQAIDAKNKVIDQLKKLGQPIDQKYLDDTATAAQSAIAQTGGAPLLTTTPPVAKAPTAPVASPAGFNYANVMKIPGMNQPVKKPAPAMAESLIWSKNFDPSKELYRRMKQGQTQ
jgi:hypothetical protein